MNSWLLFTLVVQILFAFSSASLPSQCSLPKDQGSCMAYFPSYFHNSETEKCEQFIYGGCQGNENRFESLKDCEHTCQDICVLPKQSGLCYGYFEKYYYDPTSKACKKFVYGGCMGNRNNFESLEDCETKCSHA